MPRWQGAAFAQLTEVSKGPVIVSTGKIALDAFAKINEGPSRGRMIPTCSLAHFRKCATDRAMEFPSDRLPEADLRPVVVENRKLRPNSRNSGRTPRGRIPTCQLAHFRKCAIEHAIVIGNADGFPPGR